MRQRQQQEIFSTWLAQHRGLLFKVVRAHAFTPHDRDDLFQEIATQVWQSIPNFRGRSAVTTWLYRVALHCAMAWSRKEKRHREHRETLDDHTPTLREISVDEDPRLSWLYHQIGRLDPIDRAIALLLLDGFSHREMASTLGLTESNIAVKIHRLKRALAEKSKEQSHHELR